MKDLDDPEFTRRCMNMYRRNVWTNTGIYPQLWVESRSLYPTLAGTARELGSVPIPEWWYVF